MVAQIINFFLSAEPFCFVSVRIQRNAQKALCKLLGTIICVCKISKFARRIVFDEVTVLSVDLKAIKRRKSKRRASGIEVAILGS